MKSRISLSLLIGATLIFCVSAGCSLTLGPVTKTNYTIVHPGKPLQILDNRILVKARLLDGTGDAIQQDVGGWICLPHDHWAAIQRAIEAGQKAQKELNEAKENAK